MRDASAAGVAAETAVRPAVDSSTTSVAVRRRAVGDVLRDLWNTDTMYSLDWRT
jgi:hypothetical protein